MILDQIVDQPRRAPSKIGSTTTVEHSTAPLSGGPNQFDTPTDAASTHTTRQMRTTNRVGIYNRYEEAAYGCRRLRCCSSRSHLKTRCELLSRLASDVEQLGRCGLARLDSLLWCGGVGRRGYVVA